MVRKALCRNRLRLRKIFQNGYTKDMSSKNDPHETELIELTKLEAMDAQFAKWREELRVSIQTAQQNQTSGIAAYYWASAETGLKRIKTFMNSLEEARLAMQLGSPLEVGRLKPRSTAKNKDARKQLVEHSKEVLEKHQQSAKKTKKKGQQ
jgi:hypothetical protein